MIREIPNTEMIVSSPSRSNADGPLGHNGASALCQISRLCAGILPLMAVAIGLFVLVPAAAWN